MSVSSRIAAKITSWGGVRPGLDPLLRRLRVPGAGTSRCAAGAPGAEGAADPDRGLTPSSHALLPLPARGIAPGVGNCGTSLPPALAKPATVVPLPPAAERSRPVPRHSPCAVLEIRFPGLGSQPAPSRPRGVPQTRPVERDGEPGCADPAAGGGFPCRGPSGAFLRHKGAHCAASKSLIPRRCCAWPRKGGGGLRVPPGIGFGSAAGCAHSSREGNHRRGGFSLPLVPLRCRGCRAAVESGGGSPALPSGTFRAPRCRSEAGLGPLLMITL